eukprot:TRINITY_DN1377_c0_g1_i15.p1 TRINITY_DN1377_c0_g1~~TRINITY_DN1377_c0_g1_i15.p1  ORF type:complete len:239 (-),score=6.85 TRINITY_DN1377_c0_g1_i15:277-993(-)
MIPRIALVPFAASLGLTFLYFLTLQAPQNLGLKFPSNLDDLRIIADNLNKFQVSNPGYVLLLFCSAYIFKQTFAVPGSVFLNVLAGALYGVWQGFFLCCLLTACGASLCYLLASMVGAQTAQHYFPDKINSYKLKLEENKDELLFFLLFLRLFPMSPNWALNMASGVLGVPLHLFFTSVFFGLMPYNYMCVTSGAILSELNDISEIMSWTNFGRCMLAAVISLVPSLLMKYRSKQKSS